MGTTTNGNNNHRQLPEQHCRVCGQESTVICAYFIIYKHVEDRTLYHACGLYLCPSHATQRPDGFFYCSRHKDKINMARAMSGVDTAESNGGVKAAASDDDEDLFGPPIADPPKPPAAERKPVDPPRPQPSPQPPPQQQQQPQQRQPLPGLSKAVINKKERSSIWWEKYKRAQDNARRFDEFRITTTEPRSIYATYDSQCCVCRIPIPTGTYCVWPPGSYIVFCEDCLEFS